MCVCVRLYLLKRNMWSSAVSQWVGRSLYVCVCRVGFVWVWASPRPTNHKLAWCLRVCPAEVNKSRCPSQAEHHSHSCVLRSTSALPFTSEKFLVFLHILQVIPKFYLPSNVKYTKYISSGLFSCYFKYGKSFFLNYNIFFICNTYWWYFHSINWCTYCSVMLFSIFLFCGFFFVFLEM